MKLASVLLVGHLAALLFGLAGLLVALPNPQWWSGDANAVKVFEFGMQYAGATHIVLGAAAVFVYGWVTLGPRRTTIFFLVSYAPLAQLRIDRHRHRLALREL